MCWNLQRPFDTWRRDEVTAQSALSPRGRKELKVDLSRVSLRSNQVGGAILVLSTAIMFTGAGIANFELARNRTGFGDEAEQVVAAIAANPSGWKLANVLILAAIILVPLGLIPVTFGCGGRSRAWALVGLVTFSISAVFGAIRQTVSIYLEPWIAVQGMDLRDPVVEAFSRFGEGLGEWFTILAFAAIAIYGISMTRRTQPRPAGWLFNVGSVLGLILHLIGAGIPAFIFLGTGALGVLSFVDRTFSDSSASD
jgi:hypothetical protein